MKNRIYMRENWGPQLSTAVLHAKISWIPHSIISFPWICYPYYNNNYYFMYSTYLHHPMHNNVHIEQVHTSYDYALRSRHMHKKKWAKCDISLVIMERDRSIKPNKHFSFLLTDRNQRAISKRVKFEKYLYVELDAS